MKRAVIIFAVLFLSGGVVYTAGAQHDHGRHIMMPEMKKQHQTMKMINRHWESIKKAIKAKDLRATDSFVVKIIELTPEIKNFKLHRNPDKRELFLERHTVFEEKLNNLKDAVTTSDIDAIKKAERAVQETCNNCHAMFK